MTATAATFAGDQVIVDPHMVFDTSRVLDASPEAIWPWLLQVGKSRAGWYLPARLERAAIPRARRGARSLHAPWLQLQVGDIVPDYGGRDETLEVVSLDAPRALVYRSARGRAMFSWALLLEPLDQHEPRGPHWQRDQARTRVHLRFRGRITSTGWQRAAIVRIGHAFDRATAELMLRGLAERAAPRARNQLDDDPGAP